MNFQFIIHANYLRFLRFVATLGFRKLMKFYNATSQLFIDIRNLFRKFVTSSEIQNLYDMFLGMPWYYFVVYITIGTIILRLFDKFKIIKSNSLRYLIVFTAYTLIWWITYDYVLAPQ